MNKPQSQSSNAQAHSASQGQPGQATSPGEKRSETARERAQADQERQNAGSPIGTDNLADHEREERIRRRAYQLWEEDGRQDGHAEDYWHRAVQDLDREDADLQRSGSAGKSVVRNRT
jgi:hypothetical protein